MSKKLNRKHRCCECGKIAVWYNEFGTKNRTKYYCEDCVPRGSISNVDNIEEKIKQFWKEKNRIS